MKKTMLFAAVLFVFGVFTSCLRDDDLELLRHPIHVTGSASPQFGIPVATGEMDINSLLSNLNSEFSGVLDSNSSVLTLSYSASGGDTIKAGTFVGMTSPAPHMNYAVPKGSSAKDDYTWFPKDTIFTDTIDIDFFNGIDLDINGRIDIEHIWVNLGARVFGRTSPYYQQFVKGQLDRLVIQYEDYNGTTNTFNDFVIAPIEFNNITDTTERYFDSVDVASIVNDMPRKIITSFRFRMYIRSDLLDSIVIKNIPYETVLDSLRMTELIYNGDLKVTMPLSVQLNNFAYSYSLDLGEGLSSVNLDSIVSSISEGINVDMNQSRVRLVFQNGIPLKFIMNAHMANATGFPIISLFNNSTIAAANLGSNPDNTSQFIAISDKETTIEVVLNENDLKKLGDARTLRLNFTLDSEGKHVCIRRSDFLKIKAYLIINPDVNVDISVTDNGLL